ncbi:MAG TPA: DNA polymerase III subunit beta [Candidatus Faecousia intestinigallinarum]|nr:DNA polymerase III subunit beta [Candidatus Faecousia intestinigallinarum]
MKFTCEKTDLAAAWGAVSRTVASKAKIDALEGVLCTVGETSIRLTGYNLETAISYEMEGDIKEEGSCILPTRIFGEIIRKMPESAMTVTVDKDYKVSIRSGRASFSIKAASPEDYPSLPEISEAQVISLPQRELKKMISGTLFSISDNISRLIQTGVRFEVADSTICAISSDGYRLSLRRYHWDAPTGQTMAFVVPGKSLKELERILQDSSASVSLQLSSKHILFRLGAATLICRLLDGRFLPWEKVIPTNHPIAITASVQDLNAAIGRVGLMTLGDSIKVPIRCTFSDQQLLLNMRSSAGTAEDFCNISGNGNETLIGINSRYLMEAIQAVPDDTVQVHIKDSVSAITFTPADGSDDYVYMVLPVHLAKES